MDKDEEAYVNNIEASKRNKKTRWSLPVQAVTLVVLTLASSMTVIVAVIVAAFDLVVNLVDADADVEVQVEAEVEVSPFSQREL